MKGMLGLMAAGLSIAIALPLALAQGDVSPPRGVPFDHWVPMGPDVGFVLTRLEPDPADPRIKTLKGFFMARYDGQWLRMDSDPLPRGLKVPLH
jgi:hypothetical protein